MKEKRKFIFICLAVLMGAVMFKSNVLAADVYCSAFPEAKIDASIADLVHIIVLVIQIVVPVILVVLGMIDLVKAMMAQKENEIKKGQQIFIKRLIAAILVFFIIAIVKFVISLVVPKDSSNILSCLDCFLEGSDTNW